MAIPQHKSGLKQLCTVTPHGMLCCAVACRIHGVKRTTTAEQLDHASCTVRLCGVGEEKPQEKLCDSDCVSRQILSDTVVDTLKHEITIPFSSTEFSPCGHRCSSSDNYKITLN